MEQRSEEDKLTQAPLKVTLGGREFDIAPLVIKYSREWRKKSMPLIGYLVAYSRKNTGEIDEASVQELFTTKTDEILDSFFEYARELNRDEVEGIATDGEIITAFLEVFNAFVSPLSQPVKKAPVKRVKKTRSP